MIETTETLKKYHITELFCNLFDNLKIGFSLKVLHCIYSLFGCEGKRLRNYLSQE